jgi:hypothetical protein
LAADIIALPFASSLFTTGTHPGSCGGLLGAAMYAGHGLSVLTLMFAQRQLGMR